MTRVRIASVLVGVLALSACLNVADPVANPTDPATETFAASTGVDISKMTKTPHGAYYSDTAVGTGDTLSTLRFVTITYRGYFKNGVIFDQATASTVLSLDSAIIGIAESMLGMREGGTRKIVVPSELGYGARGFPTYGIPGNTTLVYDITLVAVL